MLDQKVYCTGLSNLTWNTQLCHRRVGISCTNREGRRKSLKLAPLCLNSCLGVLKPGIHCVNGRGYHSAGHPASSSGWLDQQSSHAALRERTESNARASCSGRPDVSCKSAAAAAQSLGQEAKARTAGALSARDWRFLLIGATVAFLLHVAAHWTSRLPVWRRLIRRFVWWKDGVPPDQPPVDGSASQTTALTLYSDNAESVEWFNMCWRKMWRVYQRGLERWLADLLQPVFDNLVAEMAVPRFVQRLKILEFTLDHEAPTFSQMRRRSSRKDSDLNGVVSVRYTGGARMLLLIEVGQGKWRFKLPVLVSDLDLECKLWIKLRLAPMAPYVGTISLAFVGPPNIKVQLLPYNHVRLMRIPFLQPFLSRLLTVDLPGLMVLPKRLEINIPPAVTAVAEAAVGHDAVMRAVATAVLQADALEHALIAALPLGPQSAAGGISLPDSFHGELQVNLLEARNLPVWGFSWQSNPYCRLILGSQAERSRRDDATSHAGRHRAPVWNQEFQFLVEDPMTQVLEVRVRDSHLTGRADLGSVKFPLRNIPSDGHISTWLPVEPWTPGQKAEGQLHLKLTYKPFEDDEKDTGYREAEAFALMLQEQAITDIKSAADASSRAAVAASAAAAAVAVTKAAAARAAAKAALAAKARARKKRLEAAEKLEDTSGKRKDRLVGEDGQELDEKARLMAASLADTEASAAANGSGKAKVDGLSLEDISPEDLFPPVSFTINDRADEDMPYTRPPQPPSSSDDKAEASGRGNKDAATSGTAVEVQIGTGGDDKASASAREALETTLDRRKANGEGMSLPMVLSTLENASVKEALDLDSDISQVIEAVAKGDIRPLEPKAGVVGEGVEAKTGGGKPKALPPAKDEGPSVGRGPIDKGTPPLKVDAGLELTGSEEKSAATEAEKAKIPDGSTSVGLQQGSTGVGVTEPPKDDLSPAAVEDHAEQQQSYLQRFLGWLPFKKGKSEEEARPEGETKSVVAEVDSMDDDTIRDVELNKDIQLEAIAEEVQNSWRLKEVRTEALMQKAVARSERPWLILLSSLFSSTVVLLALVLWRLYKINEGGGGLD